MHPPSVGAPPIPHVAMCAGGAVASRQSDSETLERVDTSRKPRTQKAVRARSSQQVLTHSLTRSCRIISLPSLWHVATVKVTKPCKARVVYTHRPCSASIPHCAVRVIMPSVGSASSVLYM